MTDDRRPFARNPDFRLSGGVVRIAAVLPVPAETRRVGGVGAVRTAAQGIYAATIVRLETIDFRHGINPGRDPAEPAGASAEARKA